MRTHRTPGTYTVLTRPTPPSAGYGSSATTDPAIAAQLTPAALASLAPYGAEGLDWFDGTGQEDADNFRALLADDDEAATRFEQHRAEALAATASSVPDRACPRQSRLA
jgi:hypothetical protein